MTGSLYRRGRVWWMAYVVDCKQRCESTRTSNKRLAQTILNLRLAEIIEGRFRLPKSNSPRLKQFGEEFLGSIRHQNTRKRYASSIANLLVHFEDVKLTEINAEGIEEFKGCRLNSRVRAATVNRDLAVLRRMMKIAARRRLINNNPFNEVEMLEERKDRRQPHILTYAEEKSLLAFAPDLIRVLVTLILDTGLRSGREALALKWEDIDFDDSSIRIRQSKTPAGKRSVSMTPRCKKELLKWRDLLGPEYSEFVFANPRRPQTHLENVRKAWPKTLNAAGIAFFWLYDLRHTFASRVTQTGTPSIFAAQMMGHANTNILGTYAKASEDYKRAAICDMDAHREAEWEKLESQNPRMIQ